MSFKYGNGTIVFPLLTSCTNQIKSKNYPSSNSYEPHTSTLIASQSTLGRNDQKEIIPKKGRPYPQKLLIK